MKLLQLSTYKKFAARISWKLLGYQNRPYWQSLSFKAYLKFLLSIFFFFASMGFVMDILNHGQNSDLKVVCDVLVAGLTAAGWVYCFTHNFKFVPFAQLHNLALIFSDLEYNQKFLV